MQNLTVKRKGNLKKTFFVKNWTVFTVLSLSLLLPSDQFWWKRFVIHYLC